MGKLKVLFLLLTVCVGVVGMRDKGGCQRCRKSDGDGSYELMKKGSLTFAASGVYKPFNFEEKGKLTGFDIEIGEAIADKMGLEANPVTNPLKQLCRGSSVRSSMQSLDRWLIRKSVQSR